MRWSAEKVGLWVKNWQERWSDDLTRNKQKLSYKGIAGAALCLLKELDRGRKVGGMKDSSALAPCGLVLQQLCPREPEFWAFALAKGQEMRADPCPVRSWEAIGLESSLTSVSETVWLSWDALSPAETHVKFMWLRHILSHQRKAEFMSIKLGNFHWLDLPNLLLLPTRG